MQLHKNNVISLFVIITGNQFFRSQWLIADLMTYHSLFRFSLCLRLVSLSNKHNKQSSRSAASRRHRTFSGMLRPLLLYMAMPWYVDTTAFTAL